MAAGHVLSRRPASWAVPVPAERALDLVRLVVWLSALRGVLVFKMRCRRHVVRLRVTTRACRAMRRARRAPPCLAKLLRLVKSCPRLAFAQKRALVADPSRSSTRHERVAHTRSCAGGGIAEACRPARARGPLRVRARAAESTPNVTKWLATIQANNCV